jgi:hypothetical protein
MTVFDPRTLAQNVLRRQANIAAITHDEACTLARILLRTLDALDTVTKERDAAYLDAGSAEERASLIFEDERRWWDAERKRLTDERDQLAEALRRKA